MGIIGTLLEVGVGIGKVCGAFSGLLGERDQYPSITYTDEQDGKTYTLTTTNLKVADGEFCILTDEEDGKPKQYLLNHSTDHPLLVTRANTDELSDDGDHSYGTGETMVIFPANKIKIEKFYKNPHFPENTVIEVTPQVKVSSQFDDIFGAGYASYTVSFKNVTVNSEKTKSSSYFDLHYKDGAFHFTNASHSVGGIQYLAISAHSGLAASNLVAIPATQISSGYYRCTYDLSAIGIDVGDTFDVRMTTSIAATMTDALLAAQKEKYGIVPSPIHPTVQAFFEQLKR
jgi:hypothetical protein